MKTFLVSNEKGIRAAVPVEAGSSGQAKRNAREWWGWESVRVWQYFERDRAPSIARRKEGWRIVETWELMIDDLSGHGKTDPPENDPDASVRCEACGEWDATNRPIDGRVLCWQCERDRDSIPGAVADVAVEFRRVLSPGENRSPIQFSGVHRLHGAFEAWIGVTGSVMVSIHEGAACYAIGFRGLMGAFFESLNHGGTQNFDHWQPVDVRERESENYKTVAALLHGRRLRSHALPTIASAVADNPRGVWILDTDGDGLDDVLIVESRDAAVALLKATLPRPCLTGRGELPANYTLTAFPEYAESQGDDGDAEKNRLEAADAESQIQNEGGNF